MFKEEYRNQAYDYILETVAPNSRREEVAAIINAIATTAKVDEAQMLSRLAFAYQNRERAKATFGD